MVKDFETIRYIYKHNDNSFSGTQLEKNFQVFRATFPAIDGIDMDCEETYDLQSFIAFCKMLIGIGFCITFCPYEMPDFWTDALVEIENEFPHAVKWWNLQCYDGGNGNNPEDWAAAITKASPGHQIDNYILAGDWVEDSSGKTQQLFSGFAKDSCVGGGFIWSLDLIRCRGLWATDYISAIKNGLGR